MGDDLELASSDAERSPGVVDAIPDAVASLTALAAGLYDALAAKPGNLVLSPYSVAVALAMAVNGAEGKTAEEMLDVLGVADLDRFNGGLNALTQYMEGLAGKVKRGDGSAAELALDTANALFGQRDTEWQEPFLDTLASDYGAGMRLVDYKSAAEAARTLINDWTATQTHDRIPEILAEGVVDALTRLVLVNAIYLKAPWEEPFDTESTAKRPFRTDDGKTVQADTMSLGLQLVRLCAWRRLGGGPDPLRRRRAGHDGRAACRGTARPGLGCGGRRWTDRDPGRQQAHDGAAVACPSGSSAPRRPSPTC